jgi:hypothetical protein
MMSPAHRCLLAIQNTADGLLQKETTFWNMR